MKTKYTGIAVLLLVSVYLTACVLEGQTPLPISKGKGAIAEKDSEEDGKVLSIKASLSSIYGRSMEPEGTVITTKPTGTVASVGSIENGSITITLPAGKAGLFFVGKNTGETFVKEAILVLASYADTEEKQKVYIIVPTDENSWGFVEVDSSQISAILQEPDTALEELDPKPLKDIPSTANWYCKEP